MMRTATVVTGLRFLACLVIAFGMIGVMHGLMENSSVRLLAFKVPTWLLGAIVSLVGYRYWQRVPQIEARLAAVNGRSSTGN